MKSTENRARVQTLAVPLSDELGVLAAKALVKAYRELNEIRARDGVPYTSMGYASSVDQDYFSSVVDEINAAVVALTGKPAPCHPMLYATHEQQAKEK